MTLAAVATGFRQCGQHFTAKIQIGLYGRICHSHRYFGDSVSDTYLQPTEAVGHWMNSPGLYPEDLRVRGFEYRRSRDILCAAIRQATQHDDSLNVAATGQ